MLSGQLRASSGQGTKSKRDSSSGILYVGIPQRNSPHPLNHVVDNTVMYRQKYVLAHRNLDSCIILNRNLRFPLCNS